MMGHSVPIRSRSKVCLPLFFVIMLAFTPSLGLAQQMAQSKQDPVAPETHFDAAQTYQIAGDFDRAASEYKRGISIALERLGNLKVSTGDSTGGLETLRKATQADPGNLDSQIDLGIAYFRAGDYGNAKISVLGVLKSDSANFRAQNLLGKIDFMQGQFESAAHELQPALAITPDFDVAYSLALTDLQLKRMPQATVLFDEMQASLTDTPELEALIGQAYRQTGYLDQAVERFKKALKLDPAYPHAHAYLGMTYFAIGGNQDFELRPRPIRLEPGLAPRDCSRAFRLLMNHMGGGG